jgi:RNA polymerase sigma-70 factor (ECF subfamily)
MSGANDTSPSLERLMQLAQQGDKKAYARLFQAIVPILKAFISRRLNGMTDVDDVVQDILLSIHRAGHTYDTDRPFKIWMFAIARHRLNDHLRLVYKKGVFSEINIDEISHEIFDTDVTEDRDRREYLDKILESLPEKQKKIVTMMKLEGHSAEETAKAMKMKVSAVKVAAHRAYKALALKAGQDE